MSSDDHELPASHWPTCSSSSASSSDRNTGEYPPDESPQYKAFTSQRMHLFAAAYYHGEKLWAADFIYQARQEKNESIVEQVEEAGRTAMRGILGSRATMREWPLDWMSAGGGELRHGKTGV